jgi:hypothetical protein
MRNPSPYAPLDEDHARIQQEHEAEQSRPSSAETASSPNDRTHQEAEAPMQITVSSGQLEVERAAHPSAYSEFDKTNDRGEIWRQNMATALIDNDFEAVDKLRQEKFDLGYRHYEVNNEQERADEIARKRSPESSPTTGTDRDARLQQHLADRMQGNDLDKGEDLLPE